ncbi:interferon lambda receptor 1 isoform X2 [Salarias fasciatus]|uniref:Uncharacterized LOC115397221 n=1 Tax=Salarias fasciatus TaxID=181472 RepID=A0A672HCZ0_SALFA|nr:uncharacterized protein LOC115397221 isoform X2 [Salarias fasciatus]
MKMWSLNVMILLLFCYACLSTGEGKVFFESKNFFNVLHWDPAEPGIHGQDVLYSVRNQRYGEEQYEDIKQCQNITDLSCNLTEMTPFLHDVQYVAQVFANGTFLGSTMRFKPLADTTLGPPILETHTSESTLSVNVTLPLGPNGASIADIIASSRKGSKTNVFVYILHLTEPQWAAHVNKSRSGQFVINLKKQTKYCGHVDYKSSLEWGRKASEKAAFCVTLPDDHPVHWILVGVAVVAGLITLSVVCMCTYVRGGKPKSMPRALEAQKATRRIFKFPDDSLTVSELKIASKSENTVYVTIKKKFSVPSDASPVYSSHGVLSGVWPDSSGSSAGAAAGGAMPNPENTSAQSSEVYGAVAIRVPEEDNGDTQPVSDNSVTSDPLLSSNKTSFNDRKMNATLILHEAPTTPNEGGPERTLVLQTRRDMNGQLMLHVTGDTASPVSPERKPLLGDLIFIKDGPSLQDLDTPEGLDSGCEDSPLSSPTKPDCNSNYIPTQPGSMYVQQGTQRGPESPPESAYKPNWVHSTLQDCASTESCEEPRTNYPRTSTDLKTEEEHDDNEGDGRVDSLLALREWGIQIQDY